MEDLAAQAGRLRDQLRGLLDAPRPARPEIDHVRDRVADLVLAALADRNHPLAHDLAVLQERVEADREVALIPDGDWDERRVVTRAKRGTRPDPLRHLFMPQPGVSDPEAQRHWRLRLLLQTAAGSPGHGGRLAERLAISPGAMAAAANEGANASSVALWSQRQRMEFLEQAVAALAAPARPQPFTLVGDDYVDGEGKKVRLSRSLADFLRLLLDLVGRPVHHAEFRRARIPHPVTVKSRLQKRLMTIGVRLPIVSGVHAYTLTSAQPSPAAPPTLR